MPEQEEKGPNKLQFNLSIAGERITFHAHIGAGTKIRCVQDNVLHYPCLIFSDGRSSMFIHFDKASYEDFRSTVHPAPLDSAIHGPPPSRPQDLSRQIGKLADAAKRNLEEITRIAVESGHNAAEATRAIREAIR